MQRIKRTSNSYLKYREEKIDETCVLLEAGQGKNLNGNMFAFVREICTNRRWEHLKPVFVVTKELESDAKERFRFYHIDVKTVIRNTEEYCEYLGKAKYLITDNSFPPYFLKRENQIYLNTWHGTPLKTLGVSDIQNTKSLANIQKNYLMCDYALFPNSYTRDIFMNDYMLQNLYKGKVLLCDYPRNRVFLNHELHKNLREDLNLEDKELIAYMPTWRGGSRQADALTQKELLHTYFKEIDEQLQDHQLFYVNLHFLIGNTMDFSIYKHILPFPKDYETYDILSICDMLITDYSSVFFDYAQNMRKVILFAYDKEDYMEERGTYFPMEQLPFPIVTDVAGLMHEIHSNVIQDRSEFINEFCTYRNVDTPELIMALLVEENQQHLHIETAPDNGKDLVMVYGGKLKNSHLNNMLVDYMKQLVKEQKDKNIVLSFRGHIGTETIDTLQRMPKQVSYYAIVSRFEFRIWDQLRIALSMRFHYFDEKFNHRLKREIMREKERLFYRLKPTKVVYYSGNPQYMYKIIDAFPCEKDAHIQHGNIMGLMSIKRSYRIMIRYFHKHYHHVYDHRTEDLRRYWNSTEDTYYNKCARMANIIRIYRNKEHSINLHAIALYIHSLPLSEQDLRMKIDDHLYDPHVHKVIGFGNYMLVRYHLQIPNEDIKNMDIQNKVMLHYRDHDGYELNGSIRYALFQQHKGHNLRGKIRVFEESDTSALFRQTITNILYFTVRKRNLTDAHKEQYKLFLAYYLAKLIPMKRVVLLFEKEASRYEESASVLYEKLIDRGIPNVYFIIDKNYPYIDQIPMAYRKNLVYKTSFKHYVYFFKAKTFLSSEALVHAIDLRISNRYALHKLASKQIDYVFLQHGVMYMVSLDSESRSFFKPKKTKGLYRVVVSSHREAQHFVELGNYDPASIYICGLPKYDRNVLTEDANKIVIMPTWRPWEYNDARYEFSHTRYYQMICRIFHAIPKQYREHIVILPHPLFFDAVKDADFELKRYLDCTTKYDDILKQTKVLITDYSSIAYDAFYRGSNVIFYWEEKDVCMEQYGPTTKLMLNDTNNFGDICYCEEDLKHIFEKNYTSGQNDIYKDHFQELVEFHDGKNTERLIDLLKSDHII